MKIFNDTIGNRTRDLLACSALILKLVLYTSVYIASANDQLDAQIFNKFITIIYMFRAISFSSSGGQIVLIQHLVSSLSVGDRPVHRTVTY